ITLKLNAKAVALAEEGRKIYNLTAGQLPCKPMSELIELMRGELNFLKSFQYAPVPGIRELRDKFLHRFFATRDLENSPLEAKLDCAISNGGKHALGNALGALVNPGDEVILIAPYWLTYRPLVELWGGVAKVVSSTLYDQFIPSIAEIEKAITPKTRAIIVNSPNNPTGIHYPKDWMERFGKMLLEHQEVSVISDEIYFDLSYFDPGPTYFYQLYPELLNRTIIVDGISKNMACTGLRIGFTIAPAELIAAIGRLQGQTTSGANTLVQRALVELDFDLISTFLEPIRNQLRNNARSLRESFRQADLSNCWYQSTSAFYFLVDFSTTPMFQRFAKSSEETEEISDYATDICSDLLEKHGVALVPTADFGTPNCARISLVLEERPFAEAINLVVEYLNQEK
ncbi:MAG: aminotransferase class I/II-fold pyridoxal phosphate-dependent enzyme, partial [Bdellovibrionales bacterium]|nr:aminotransferase class I/II-fold pyridoxal phosphate-dependent enzyme [Bdellovibrionales bacterium]